MRTEKVVAFFFLLGLVFRLMHWPGAGIFIILSLGFLSCKYLFENFYFFKGKSHKPQNSELRQFGGIALSVALLGIIYRLQFWPGAGPMLLVGALTTMITLFINLILKSKSEDEELLIYHSNMVKRSLVIGLTTCVLYFTSTATLLSIYHSDDPEMVRLKTQSYDNPQNEEFRMELEAYQMKLDSTYYQDS